MLCLNPNSCPDDGEQSWHNRTHTTTSSSTVPSSSASLCTTSSVATSSPTYTTSSVTTTSVIPCENPNACPQAPGAETIAQKTYTINVPTSQTEHIKVHSNDCARHCSAYISKARQCFQYNRELPPWGSAWQDTDHTPVYESYPCLVCLNLPALIATPTHPEFGNDLRETQDLINAIYTVSVSSGIPPQLAFSMALQESLGSVRPHSGDQGASRGTFQVQIPGAVTCFQSAVGTCTTEQIKTMVSLGVCGQNVCQVPYQRPGIASYWAQNAAAIGFISRGYNSGSVYDWNDLTVVQFGTNSYSSDIVNRMMGRVVAGFFTRTCCARCGEGRKVLEVKTCGPVDGSMSDFCGDERYSFHGKIG